MKQNNGNLLQAGCLFLVISQVRTTWKYSVDLTWKYVECLLSKIIQGTQRRMSWRTIESVITSWSHSLASTWTWFQIGGSSMTCSRCHNQGLQRGGKYRLISDSYAEKKRNPWDKWENVLAKTASSRASVLFWHGEPTYRPRMTNWEL